MEYLKIEDEIKYYKKRYKMKKEIEDMFIREGYTHIELAGFENLDNIISLYNNIKKESMVKVLDGKSDVLILRTDNTTSIIKKLIPRWEYGIKLKLFYNSTVFRNSPNSGIKEIKQLGIEYLGEAALKADKEVIKLALNILNRFNNGFILEISNSKYICGLFKDMNITKAKKQQLKEFIYRKNRSDLTDFIKDLNLPRDIYNCLLNLLDFQGDIIQIVDSAKSYYMNEIMEEALDELLEIKDFIDRIGYSKNVYFDLSMMMELDYYDGTIFKGYYHNSVKDIIYGGRYDSFTEEFGKRVPAIGFSLDPDGLIDKYLEKEGE